MKVIKEDNSEVTIQVSEDELLAINNSLNEVRGLIDDEEFFTRLGVKKSFVGLLLKQIGDCIDSLKKQR